MEHIVVRMPNEQRALLEDRHNISRRYILVGVAAVAFFGLGTVWSRDHVSMAQTEAYVATSTTTIPNVAQGIRYHDVEVPVINGPSASSNLHYAKPTERPSRFTSGASFLQDATRVPTGVMWPVVAVVAFAIGFMAASKESTFKTQQPTVAMFNVAGDKGAGDESLNLQEEPFGEVCKLPPLVGTYNNF